MCLILSGLHFHFYQNSPHTLKSFYDFSSLAKGLFLLCSAATSLFFFFPFNSAFHIHHRVNPKGCREAVHGAG
jgi:hypothetical protein